MLITFLVRLLGLLLAYCITVLTTLYIGIEGYGYFASIISTGTILASLLTIGTPTWIVRALSIETTADERSRIITCSLWLTLFISALIITILIFAYFIFSNIVIEKLLSIVLVGIVFSFIRLRQAISLVLDGSTKSIAPEQLVLPILYILTIYIFSQSLLLSQTSSVYLYVLAAIVSFIAGFAITNGNGYYLNVTRNRPTFNSLKTIAKKSIPFLFSELPRTMLSTIDIIIIATLISTEAAGIYAIASRIANLTSVPMLVINMTHMPIFAKLFAVGEIDKLKETARKATGWCVISSIVVGIVVYFLIKYILLLVGISYEDISEILPMLIFAQVANNFFGPNATILKMTGQEIPLAYATWIWAIVLIMVTLFAGKSGNLLFTVTAIATITISGNFMLNILVRIYCNLWLLPKFSFPALRHSTNHK